MELAGILKQFIYPYYLNNSRSRSCLVTIFLTANNAIICMMNWKECERKKLWPVSKYYTRLPVRTEENHMKSVRISYAHLKMAFVTKDRKQEC
jgi:hypothetical protein